jgi:16S rRNA (cytosine1402-N4)-methyltransferase
MESRGESAAELVNNLPEAELTRIIRDYGEERFARRVARAILAARARAPISRTLELAELVRRAVPEAGGIDAATRTFQALRIAVNDEFSALETFLRLLPSCLNAGGRVVVLSFHSGEDRRVKKSFEAARRDGLYAEISADVLRPGPEERRANPRSTPAKLRWARKSR